MADDGTFKKVRIFYMVMLGAAGLSLILQIIGLVTAAWLVVDFGVMSKEFRFSMGLWYVNYCYKGVCCTSGSGEFWEKHYHGPKKIRLVNHDMLEYQIETIVAIVTTIVLIVCVSKLLCCSPNGIHSNSVNVWRVILAASALGILALVAAIKYGDDIMDAHEAFEAQKPSPYKEPWSLVFTGVGGLVLGLIFIAWVIETCRAAAEINGFDPTPHPIDRSWYRYPREVWNYVWNRRETRY